MPERDSHALARTGLEAAVAGIPWVGGPAQVLLTDLLPAALTRRRDEWLRELGHLVNDLASQRGVKVEDLANDSRFVSAVVNASRIALGTHLEEKVELLKRVLLRVALDPGRDDFLTARLLVLIDDLSPEHFLVLGFARDPGGAIKSGQVTQPRIVFEGRDGASAVGDLGLGQEVLDEVLDDLERRRLARVERAGQLWSAVLTPLGCDLVALVEDI